MFKFIRGIFSGLWKLLSFFRGLVLNLLFLAFVVIIIQGLNDAPEIEIPNNSALFIAPSGTLVDQSSYNPNLLDALNTDPDRSSETVVRDIIQAIDHARDDDDISGIILRLDYLQSASMSKVEEIGQALNYFKESSKPVIAIADSMGQQQYLLASYADEIYIHSLGGLYLTGFGVYRNYFKSAADKLELKFHVFRAGEFKDAVEPFMRNDMSEASREHVSLWLNQLWQRYTGTIEAHRDLHKGELDNFVNNLDTLLQKNYGDAAQLAIDNGLVDGVFSRNQLKDTLKQRFGTKGKKHEINAIGMYSYLNNPLAKHSLKHKDKIGLIVASGNIMDGEQPEGTIGSDTLRKIIETARNDKSLKALVVRVDSGGGSAFASELIRDELEITREAGLPIYISMGSVAASGGYWISAPANEIWATPSTLTGSIGVFGLVPNISQSLEKIGVHSDGVGTSPIADAFNIDRSMSPETQRVIQSGVDNIYRRFLSLVAEARNSTPEEIDHIAQGRVWSGETALQLGLVDKLGSLADVIKSAAKDQDLSQYTVKEITRELSPKEQLIRTFLEQTSTGLSNHNISLELSPPWLSLLESQAEFDLLSKSLGNNSNSFAGLEAFAQCTECSAP